MTPSYETLPLFTDTVFMEASGEGYLGMRAVANVIINRAIRRRKTIKYVCLRPWQFSAWNKASDPNRRRLMNTDLRNPAYRECMRACLDAFDVDETKGSDHYFALSIPTPSWAFLMTETLTLGAHRFYRS